MSHLNQLPDGSPELLDWEGFAITKNSAGLFFRNYSGYETRNESTLKIICQAVQQYGVKNFKWVLISTGDIEAGSEITDLSGHKFKCFSYSTQRNNHHLTIPDFVFDHWEQTGLDDYESTRNWLKRLDHFSPETNCLGWRGANTNPTRSALTLRNDKINYDCEFVTWDRSSPDRLTAENFLSFPDQVKKWRFFIDMEGRGYSGRLKLLLASPRLVFIQERVHEEFFFPNLIAWVHYIPVQNNLSNLEENLDIVRSNPSLEKEIIANQRNFSQLYLTRDFALYKMAQILTNIDD